MIFYDADGRLSMLTHVDLATKAKSYYNVVTNTQGDVIKLLGGSGAVRATYTYDAWGNATVTTTNTLSQTIANANSI